MKTLLALVTTAAITLVFAASVQAATPRERALVRQVKTLKAQKANLTRERKTARTQLATANSQLATAQQGTAQAVSTMSPIQITETLFPTIYNVFEAWNDGFDDGDLWTSNYTTHTVDGAGDDSWSYSFSLYQS